MASPIKAIDDFCRLCAVESQSGVIIYSAEGENLCLEEKIISCLRIEVSRDDMLPKRVCQSCNLLLEDYYRFSERATQVQQTLYFLLGLHLPHPHEQDSQLYLINNGVKLESHAIKKELDEFIIHQGNLQIEAEKFDLLASRENSLKNQKSYYNVRHEKEMDSNVNVEVSKEIVLEKELEEENEVKQIHRRKMLMPKKSVQEEESDKNYEMELLSSEEEEENKKMVTEWKKNWGIMCDQCKNVLQDRFQFEKHYKCLHNRKPVYTCSYCNKSLDKHTSYKLHIFEHINSGKFRCKFCNKKFCTKEMLQIHLSSVHSQIKVHICEECGKSFTSQTRLDFHQKKHKKPVNEDLRCTECGKTLQTRGGLAAHKSVHKLGRHFMCHICGKTFTQKINMQQHVKHHKGERPHSCDICEKSFAEKSHLNRHKSFHTKERPFQCPICKKMYKTERCLKVHSQIHWNSRPYVCSFCGKGFLSSTKLKQHHNCHTGERPFACKYCEKTFTNYPNWLKHTRRRHKVDHKTGLSLKEESRTQFKSAENRMPHENTDIADSAIEFIEIPEVEVKEDDRDSVQSHHSVLNMISPAVLGSQFQIVQGSSCQYQMNLLPDLASSQVVYSDQVIVHQPTILQ